MRTLVFILLSVLAVNLYCQNISRQVYGTAGQSVIIGGTDYSYTIGEPVVTTITAGSITLTQGFQQPERFAIDSIIFEKQDASCKDASDGLIRIIGLPSCQPLLGRFFWEDGDTSRIKTNLPAGTYVANFICLSSPLDTIRVSITIGSESEEPCLLKFYSGFTPNKDGINDYWHIDNIEVFTPNTIQIYNRWGDMIWQGESYDNNEVRWDGNEFRNGLPVPDGTYFYVAKVKEQLYKGWVELTR